MNYLSMLQLPISAGILYAVPFIVALMVIVFIHELGHFLVARWCGVSVEAFSIGFGREVTGWNDRHGTRWKLSWIPLGGYVKFKGDANAASIPDAATLARAADDPGNFHGKRLWQRAAVVAAGPVANFILAIVIFSAAFMFVGTPITEPRVDDVLAGSAAEQAGIQKGDLVISIEGKTIENFSDLQQAVITRAGEPLAVVIERNGQRIALTIVPQLREEPDGFGGKMRIGLMGVRHNPEAVVRFQRMGPVAAVKAGVERTMFIVDTTFRYLGKLVTGRERADQLGGPIAMAKAAGDAASVGFFQFVNVMHFCR